MKRKLLLIAIAIIVAFGVWLMPSQPASVKGGYAYGAELSGNITATDNDSEEFNSTWELRKFIYNSGFSKRIYPPNKCGQRAFDFKDYADSLGYDVDILYYDRPSGRDHIKNLVKIRGHLYSFDVLYPYGLITNLDWWGVK